MEVVAGHSKFPLCSPEKGNGEGIVDVAKSMFTVTFLFLILNARFCGKVLSKQFRFSVAIFTCLHADLTGG